MYQEQEAARAMRVKEAAAFLGIGQATFWRWSQQGILPRGIRLSARCTVWRRGDLEAFLERQAKTSEASR